MRAAIGVAHLQRAVALLRPCIETTIAVPGVSHDRALVIVVAAPDADAPPLARFAFGRAALAPVDYDAYARGKAAASLRAGCDSAQLGAGEAGGEPPLVGGLHRRGVTLGVSGAMPAFDEAIGAMVIELAAAIASNAADARMTEETL